VSESMSKRRRVPEDLMGSILGGDPGASGGERASSELRGLSADDREPGSPFPTGDGPISWEEQPARVGIAFNLSKQVIRELDRLRLEIGLEEDIRTSNSEIAELALRTAIEDTRERWGKSELFERLNERPATQAANVTGEGERTTRRSVDESGLIFETVYDENGEVVDEDVVASVADLPVETEYMDEEGRLVSLAKDELGNTFEQVLDDQLNPLATRLLSGADPAAR